jgi:hypothetical protein
MPFSARSGGSFPQNTREMNPCPCRMSGVMLLDRVVTEIEIKEQYHRALSARHGRRVPRAAPHDE